MTFVSRLKKYLPIYLLFFLITLCAFFPSIKGEFFYDDTFNIVRNDHIKSVKTIGKIFTSSATSGSSQLNNNFFRPVKSFNYFIIYQLFGLNATVFHLNNIILHSLCSFVFFLNFRLLSIPKVFAILLTLIHCVHPAFSMNVAYISGIADPLCVLFISISFYYFLTYITQRITSPKILYISAGIYTFSLLSKENSIAYALFILLFILIMKVKKYNVKINKYVICYTLSIISMASLFYIMKMTLWDFTGANGLALQKNIFTENVFIRVNTFIHTIKQYISTFYFPIHLGWSKSNVIMTVFNIIWGSFGLLVILSVIIGIYFSSSLSLTTGLIWLLSFIAPFTLIIPLNSKFLDHWLYPLSFGILLINYHLLKKILRKDKLIIGLMILFISGLSIKTFQHSKIFTSIYLFFLNEKKIGWHQNNSIYLINYYEKKLRQAKVNKLDQEEINQRFNLYLNEIKDLYEKADLYGYMVLGKTLKSHNPYVSAILLEAGYTNTNDANIQRIYLLNLIYIAKQLNQYTHARYFYNIYRNLSAKYNAPFEHIKTIYAIKPDVFLNKKELNQVIGIIK